MKPFTEHNPKLNVKFKVGDYAMHGDVILVASDEPEGFADMLEVKDACVAYGEATGHAHKIFGESCDFELREHPQTKERHLRVVSPVMLKHQEHSPIKLPPGFYRIGIQHEYDPFEKRRRQVID